MIRLDFTRSGRIAISIAVVALLAGGAVALSPQERPERLSLRDSFRIGSRGILCTAQRRPLDPAAPGMFDRAYAIVCRDAAASVGSLQALRIAGGSGRAATAAPADLDCAAPMPAAIEGLAGATVADCSGRSDRLPYRLYSLVRGRTLYVARGLRGYDSALSLGLRTLVADRPVDGEVAVAITDAGDPLAFARVQAGALDSESARTEGYLRNNAGSFAEAAQFFDALIESGGGRPGDVRATEHLLNRGLQQSNLGNFTSAETAFLQAETRGAGRDLILGRLLRNYRAIDALNRRNPAAALTLLDAPVAAMPQPGDAALSAGRISEELSGQVNRSGALVQRIGGIDTPLLPAERARILDGQAAVLRGAALRLQNRNRDALAAFAGADSQLRGVRENRVVSKAFLEVELRTERALTNEALGDIAAAEKDLNAAIELEAIHYPNSPGLLMAKARLGAFRLRRGDEAAAMALYGEVVADCAEVPGAAASVRNLLRPYFALLARRAANDPGAVAAMFAANQILIRPGLAQTQAILARELSAGDDEAARLFRESVNRSREVTRLSGEVAQLAGAGPAPETPEARTLAEARERLAGVQREQVSLQSQLSAFPRYRVVDSRGITLADLQKTLGDGEAFYEMRIVGDDAYAMLVTAGSARAFKLGAGARELATHVARLRDSIVRVENNAFVTEPFDVALAHRLYQTLFGPVDGQMKQVTHLIYEGDGPLLQLPPNLLVTDAASVAAYADRAGRPDADPFDFTGVAWLGRGRDVTTAVSPRGFVDVRAASPSRARRSYLGLGQNARPETTAPFLSATPPAAADPCTWPTTAWENPISSRELFVTRDLLGSATSTVLVDDAFTDQAIMRRDDLASYRVLHFATHGLVTAPEPGCAAQPALLTTIGGAGSDGLLTFSEIYDLRIDADIVLLSACDTAGMATIDATRAAGLATGGDFVLDGLVRAFVGAGARTVVASHWPIPDDYDATSRLVVGMFKGRAGTPVATALRLAETALMDDPATSHPYYWAAFAVIGDGRRPIMQAN